MIFNMGNTLVKSAVTSFGIQWGLFVIAATLKTEKFYDLAGSSTFIYLTYRSLQWGQKYFLRQHVQSGMVMLWAARLGFHLSARIFHDGKDARFDDIRENPVKFFAAWSMQGLWVFTTLLPTLILNSKQTDKPLSPRDYAGWSLWVIGFLFEAIADRQKSAFRANPDNAGKFINTGLWSISRHPNYLGEILLWFGLYTSASSVMQGSEYLSVISPLFVTYLLTSLSGIPLLEKSGMKRWGSDPAYQQYVKNTAVLIPGLW